MEYFSYHPCVSYRCQSCHAHKRFFTKLLYMKFHFSGTEPWNTYDSMEWLLYDHSTTIHGCIRVRNPMSFVFSNCSHFGGFLCYTAAKDNKRNRSLPLQCHQHRWVQIGRFLPNNCIALLLMEGLFQFHGYMGEASPVTFISRYNIGRRMLYPAASRCPRKRYTSIESNFSGL